MVELLSVTVRKMFAPVLTGQDSSLGSLEMQANSAKSKKTTTGGDLFTLVEHIGFEPMTSSMPWKRASQLR